MFAALPKASNYVLGLTVVPGSIGTFPTWMRNNIVGASIVLIAMVFIPVAICFKQYDRRRIARDGGLSMIYGGQLPPYPPPLCHPCLCSPPSVTARIDIDTLRLKEENSKIAER